MLLQRVRYSLTPFLTVVIAVVVWEVLIRLLDIPPYLLPTPYAVTMKLSAKLVDLTYAGLASLYAGILGLILSLVIIVPIAVLVVRSEVFRTTVYPLIAAFHAIPIISIAPMLVIWFGFGTEFKVATVVIITFFPLLVQAIRGLSDIDPDIMYLVKALGASEVQIIQKIRLPNAVPYLIDGLKIALPTCLIGAIVAEYIASGEGIGRLVILAQQSYDVSMIFAAVIIVFGIVVLLFSSLFILERLSTRWRPR